MLRISLYDFLPTIAICDSFEEAVKISEQTQCNLPQHWQLSFRQTYDNGTFEEQPAIDCHTLIDSWTDLEPEERQEIKEELLFPGQLCPNTTAMELKGSVLSRTRFTARVVATETAISEGYVDTAVVYTQEVSRYFEPLSFRKKGFKSATVLSADFFRLSRGTT